MANLLNSQTNLVPFTLIAGYSWTDNSLVLSKHIVQYMQTPSASYFVILHKYMHIMYLVLKSDCLVRKRL